MKRFWIGLLMFGLGLAPTALWASFLFVQVEKARLLKRPSAFSATKAFLPHRTRVTVVEKQGAYYRIQSTQGEGFVSEMSLSIKAPAVSSKIKGDYVSSDEVAMATKGFNAQVESEYRKSNTQLPYADLDQWEAQTRYPNPQKFFLVFRQQGKLGEFQPGGGQE